LTTGCTLVTGVTGFVGREVTRRLLASGRRVAVLARPRGGASATERVAAALVPGAAHVTLVEGDLASRAGIDSRALAQISPVDTVIHCAGDTTFEPEDVRVFRRGHVDGPCALLASVLPAGLARWVQLSTSYVCGRRTGTVYEHEGDVGQSFHNTYERVKLEAETAIRALGTRVGVDVRVLRPSVVVGSAPDTAGGVPSRRLFEFLRLGARVTRRAGHARLRVEAAPGAAFNLVPLEFVTAAVVALAQDPRAAGGTFHLVCRDAPSQAAVLEMIAARLGVLGLALVDRLDAPSPEERRLARALAPYREYLAQDVRFDDAAARPLLEACGVAAPALRAHVVGRLVEAALHAPRSHPPGIRVA
jgi:nucleoside-diphosphate-sugar epimerase